MLKGFLFFAAVGAIFSNYDVFAENEKPLIPLSAVALSETRGRVCLLST